MKMRTIGQCITKAQRKLDAEVARIRAALDVARCDDCGRDHCDGGQVVVVIGKPADVWVCGDCYAENYA